MFRSVIAATVVLSITPACGSDADANASTATGTQPDAAVSSAAKPDASAATSAPGTPPLRDAGTRPTGGAAAPRSDSGSADIDAGAEKTDSATQQPVKPPRIDAALVPWGVALSASTSRTIDEWAPVVAASGARWVRGFRQDALTHALTTLSPHELALSGIFHWSSPSSVEDTLPTADIAGWQQYITALLAESQGKVTHWEVWNEPPNFTVNKSPADYAKIVQSAYTTAKAIDPNVSIGLAAQSVNLHYLAEALDAGARDHFDYVTLHPYEVLGLVRQGFEAQFMSIVPSVRKLLADKNPAKKDVPIHFTELGEPISKVTPEQQADQLTKAFVMSLAQGVERTHWFEVTDGDSGRFGLVDVSATRRPAFHALAKLVEVLGEQPRYEGWTLLSERAYAFVFASPNGPVAVAWAPPDSRLDVSFESEIEALEIATMDSRAKSLTLSLGNSPVLIRGVSDALVQEARSNRRRPFPWGGDYSQAPTVNYTAAAGAMGVHPIGEAPVIRIDNVTARNMSGEAGTAFAIDPNFNSYTPVRLRIETVVRRNGPAPASFTLYYESTTGPKVAGTKYEIPGSDQWYTQTLEIADPQFVGKWGYHILLESEAVSNADYSLRSISITKL